MYINFETMPEIFIIVCGIGIYMIVQYGTEKVILYNRRKK